MYLHRDARFRIDYSTGPMLDVLTPFIRRLHEQRAAGVRFSEALKDSLDSYPRATEFLDVDLS